MPWMRIHLFGQLRGSWPSQYHSRFSGHETAWETQTRVASERERSRARAPMQPSSPPPGGGLQLRVENFGCDNLGYKKRLLTAPKILAGENFLEQKMQLSGSWLILSIDDTYNTGWGGSKAGVAQWTCYRYTLLRIENAVNTNYYFLQFHTKNQKRNDI